MLSTLRWRVTARRHPSAFLLAAQLLSLVIYPLFDELAGGRVVFGAFGVLVLALVVWVVNWSPAVNWVAWALAVPAFLLSLASVLLHSQTLLVASSALEALLYFYAAGALIAYMMSDHRVTSDELFAAGATFTLLAWGFAYAFPGLSGLVSGEFHKCGGAGASAQVAGAVVPEFHQPLRGGPGRRHSAQFDRASVGHAGAVRGCRLRGRRGVAADRPDDIAARGALNGQES